MFKQKGLEHSTISLKIDAIHIANPKLTNRLQFAMALPITHNDNSYKSSTKVI